MPTVGAGIQDAELPMLGAVVGATVEERFHSATETAKRDCAGGRGVGWGLGITGRVCRRLRGLNE